MRRPMASAGFTLVELLVALLLGALVVGSALAFLRQQEAAVFQGARQLTVWQTLRYALEALRQDIAAAGAGLPVDSDQPALVFVGPDQIVFNADLVGRVAVDKRARFVDPDVPLAAAVALPRARAITIPGTSYRYPAKDYLAFGLLSEAETIGFRFRLDDTTPEPNDYLLERWVNDQPPEIVARGLYRNGTAPFFRYFNANGDSIPGPLFHSVPGHATPADSGAAARIDSVRVVQVEVAAVASGRGVETRRAIQQRIYLVNLDAPRVVRPCSDDPRLGVALDARVEVASGPSATDTIVLLRWPPALDQRAGEQDIVRYVVLRRMVGDPDTTWVPIDSRAATDSVRINGQAVFEARDTAVRVDSVYEYALQAIDCSPASSALVRTAPVRVRP